MISLLLISLAHYGALGAPVGAAEPSVAQAGVNTPALGAQRRFHLFYPELPTLRPARESTTEVAVIQLQETDNFATMGEKTPENILEMIPKELLDSNKKIRPINVHIIEHDDFIDYEIEFVELSDNNEECDEGIGNRFTPKESVTYKAPTTTPKATSRRVTPLSFVNLLKSARKEHRQRDESDVNSKKVTTRKPVGSTMKVTELRPRFDSKSFLNKSLTRRLSGKTLYENSRTNLRRRNQIRNDNKASVINLVNPTKSLSHQLVSQNVRDPDFIKNTNGNRRFLPKSIKSGKRTKPETLIKTTRLEENTEHPSLKIQPTTTMQAYQKIETLEDIPSLSDPQLWSSIHPSNDSPTPTSLLSYMTSSMMSYQDSRTLSVVSSFSDSSILPAYLQSYRSSSVSSSFQSSSRSRMSTYSHLPSISIMPSYTLSTTSSYLLSRESLLSSTMTSSIKPTSSSLFMYSKYQTSMSRVATLSSFGKLPESTRLVSFEELSSLNKLDEKIIDDEAKKSDQKTIENTVESQTNISMQDTSEEKISNILSSKSLIEEVKQKLITISYDLTKHYEGKNNTTNTTKEPVNLLVDKNDSIAPIMEKTSTAKYETLTLANITGREGQEDDEVKEVEENYEDEEDNEGEEEVNTVKPNANEEEVMSHRIMITEATEASSLEGASKSSDNKTSLQNNINEKAHELKQQATEKPTHTTSSTTSLIDLKHKLSIATLSNLTGGHSGDISNTSKDEHFSESSSVLNLHTLDKTSSIKDGQNLVLKESNTYRTNISETERSGSGQVIHIFENISEDKKTLGQEPSEGSSEQISPQPERSPKLITSRGSLSQLGEHSTILARLELADNEVAEGQHNIVHPGQEHAEGPGEEDDEAKGKKHIGHHGQDHEEHPGQYHEHHPGQYNEKHPGQYHEVHPGQYDKTKEDKGKTHDNLGVENVTVDFEHGQESRIYNVQANAGEFIIGEVGKIDINSGQTLQGVRYTALEGEVDEAQILDILEKYFGARTR